MSLTVNSPAPAFTLPDQNNTEHTLSEYLGSWLLIYFYPKDDTPGCTTQACTLRDSWNELKQLNCQVVGISKDSVASHAKFAKRYTLPFTLLADEDTTTIQAYGAWQEKSMYGKKYLGTTRMSVLINPEGKIAKIYPKVKPAEQAAEVIADLRNGEM